MGKFPARVVLVLALLAGTCAVLAWRLGGGGGPDRPDGPEPPDRHVAHRPGRTAVPGPGEPVPRSTGRASEPPKESPPSLPAGPDGRIQLGPRVGADTWIEAEIRNTEHRCAWRVYLAYASERDCLYVDCIPNGPVALVEVRGGTRRALGKGAPHEPRGETETLTARGRDGRWSVWLGGARVLSGEFRPPAGARAGFSAVEGGSSLARLGVWTPSDPAFFDEFMREPPAHTAGAAGGLAAEPRGDETWRALSGRWELAGVHFAERSANPFALRARFPGEETPDPFLDLRPKARTPGVGVHFSSWRGVVNVERITGGGPASEAGVREHDIVLAIDDQPCLSVDAFTFFEDLEDRPPGTEVKLTLLRPGELRTRDVTLKSRVYRWGRARLGEAIAGSAAPGPETMGALAVAGESFWDGYRYEASVMIPAHGGAGLAFAVRDRDNHHLLRAVGDAGGTGLASNRLALVRVRGGKETVLAERKWGPRAGMYYRMAVDLEGEHVRAYVDGKEVFETKDSDLPAGKIGLWALKGAGAYFDDVAVSTDRASTAPKLQRRATAIEAAEQDMRTWANPADEWVPDPKSDWWWNMYRFPGGARVTVSPEAKHDRLDVALGCSGAGEPDGIVVRVTRDPCTFGVLRPPIAAPELTGERLTLAEPLEFQLSRDGQFALREGGRTIFRCRPGHRGDRIGVRGLKNLDDPGVVTVTSDGVRDYFFRRAPVDWAVECGRWGIKNKWICDPRFSWFGGHSRSLAAIWNKHRFGGDVTLDFYAALVMRFDDPPYERVGDFNCAILADGRSLASGYTLVVSGGRNRWTRLYGAGKLLAESRDASHRMPSNVNDDPHRRDLHQRWFRITLERAGGRVRFLFDGKKVFDLPDTLRRKAGHCALWTQDNGMLVSRARIAADTIEKDDALAWRSDLVRRELGGLTNSALGELWARLDVDGKGPSGEPAVRVTNARAGGAFAAASARKVSSSNLITFHFRAEPGAKVDLYFEREARSLAPFGPFRVRLTGPRGDRERHPVLAGPLAAADGRWHRVEVDLGLLARAWNASRHGTYRARFVNVRPTFCNLEEGDGDDYLPGGIGGNGPGARYWVSGFRVEPALAGDRSPPVVRSVLFPGEGGTRAGTVRVVFEDAREPGRPLLEAPPGEGAARRGSGVDERSILVALVGSSTGSWRPGSRAVVAGGDTLLPYGHGALRFDARRQELEIDLAATGVTPGRGGKFAVEVRSFRDRAGNAGSPIRREWRRRKDRSGPVLVELSLEPAIRGEVDLAFEPGTRGVRDLGARARPFAPILSLDETTTVGGASSLRLTVPEIRSYAMFAIQIGYVNLDRLLSLSFDYRLPDQTPVNLLVHSGTSWDSVLFTDRGDPASDWSHSIRCAGEFDDARADGRWHRASLPLAATFRRAYPRLRSYPARGILFADWGWRGLWPGDGYWIDNLRIEGARRGRDLAVSWRAFDLSGVADAAWALDRSPGTVPAAAPRRARGVPSHARIEIPEAARLPDGPAWFHLRLKDRAGNWSRTFHKRVLLDNAPPRVVRLEPGDGEASARRGIAVYFDDYSGVDVSTVKLRVAVQGAEDRVHALDNRACRFDRAEGVLRWSARGAGREAELVPGARVDVELLAARDLAGNEIELPVRWSWIYDATVDRDPPPAPNARLTMHRSPAVGSDPKEELRGRPMYSDTNDFERELGQVERTSGCDVELAEHSALHGKLGARITVTPERRGKFVARLRERYWHADERPYLLFDYRLPREGVRRLALRLDLLREKREIELVGPKAERPLVTDGRWHRAVVDLGERIRKWGVKVPVFRARPYRLAGRIHLVGLARVGSVIDIDNVELARKDWRGAVVEITMPEGGRRTGLSELDGFAVAWDRRRDTVPPEVVTHPLPPWKTGSYRWVPPGRDRVGLWYCHVRARDLAGNWGPTTHLAVDLAGEAD